MQQQLNPQEQCGPQQQLPQPVMICPIQYVYETPTLVPQVQQTPGEQIQQNQILINVKNPPPWIQNRPQNQIVYVQQIPNNYQPYMHPQMIQNPMYQPQMTYQIQPMIGQDNRQYIQIPNLNQLNTVQNPAAQIQPPVIAEESDKMPVLTQMLTQRHNNVRTTTINHVRPANINSIANIVSTANNIVRPSTQNQQVQTEIATNTKGRPRNVPPQLITINPMQQRPFLANQKQEMQMNMRPQMNMPIRQDVPQHIRTKIPSSISVKTVNRPVLSRPMIRPLGVMQAPQNFYYNLPMMAATNVDTSNKTILTNAENQNLKTNIVQAINPVNNVQMQLPVTASQMPFVKTELKSPRAVATTGNAILNPNMLIQNNINAFVKTNDDNVKQPNAVPGAAMSAETHTQTEEKLLRNTVFVQARNRILNEKETVPTNTSLKRPMDVRNKEENKSNIEAGNIPIKTERLDHNVSKLIKVEEIKNETAENTKPLVNISAPENSEPTKVSMTIQAQQSRISNLQMKTDNSNIKLPALNMPVLEESVNASQNATKLQKSTSSPDKDLEELIKPAIVEVKKDDSKKSFSKASIKQIKDEKTVQNENIPDDVKKKEDKVTVLTHVLEGYIIQESNVAFPIQKPMREKDIKKEKKTMKSENKKEDCKKFKSEDRTDNNRVKTESKGNLSWEYINSTIQAEKEVEFAVEAKENPFTNIKKPTVESWTAEELSSHLQKHNWKETASKLREEEIDGESLLLVNKDQLIAIGVSEEHAEAIVAFATKNS